MTKISVSNDEVALAQSKIYKSPFDRQTSLFNVKATKEANVPHKYTRKTYAPSIFEDEQADRH